MYAAEPGDMTAAQSAARLPNCTAANLCTTAGDGDGKVDAVGVAIRFNAAAAGEQLWVLVPLEHSGPGDKHCSFERCRLYQFGA